MKTAISVPDSTFARVDDAAGRLGMSRSEFFSRAAERWLDVLADEQTTQAIDEVLAHTVIETEFAHRAADALARTSDSW